MDRGAGQSCVISVLCRFSIFQFERAILVSLSWKNGEETFKLFMDILNCDELFRISGCNYYHYSILLYARKTLFSYSGIDFSSETNCQFLFH